MDTFQLIVVSIAIVLLIVLLTYVGVQMKNPTKSSKGNLVFPPVKNSCPDLWQSKDVDGKTYCKIPEQSGNNIGDLYMTGKFSSNSIPYGYMELDRRNQLVNFADSGWSTGGKSTECNQKNWANKHGILWDGISNYNQC